MKEKPPILQGGKGLSVEGEGRCAPLALRGPASGGDSVTGYAARKARAAFDKLRQRVVVKRGQRQ